MQPGSTVSPWKLGEQIDRGGNARVWSARRGGRGKPVALTIIHATKSQRESYRRFVQEIEFIRTRKDDPGVLPLLDAYLPERPTSTDRPWLAMPIATPIRRALDGKPLQVVVEALGEIAVTLSRLAAEKVGHRDIKPGNLYELNGRWLVGDFGLVAAPDLDELTREGKALGPAHFTAYEMIRDPVGADPLPADVYSFAKTLWVLATVQEWPPEGHQAAGIRGFSIAALRPHPHADVLDRLVDRSTLLHPEDRPTMAEVAADLQVTLEARRPGGEFAPAAGVAIYHRGSGLVCTLPRGTPVPSPVPTPAPVPCTFDWSSEVLAYVTRPTETTEYRLHVGPLASNTVTITVANPLPEAERCNEVTHTLAKPLLQAVPERTRIVYGEKVRVRGTFAYELCGRLVYPQTLPGIESLRAGARFPDQPARRLLAGPVREPSGVLVWEFAPVQTSFYRLHYAGTFGEFETRVEVAPRLELELEGGPAHDRVSVRVQAHASTALRGVTVTLERRTGGSGWESLRTLTLDRSLSAVVQITVGSSDVELRARVPSTLRHASATSRPILVSGS